ncbi:hypothetical protein H4Q32_031148 [Labeo rohita]|uniref:Transposase Tc1-like domain-containing protein n=1 Tax=Labeo rohita TaxID=84645 RepID=A0ABQ8L8C0_LABRO|nr:hypothetical protein H4Q32_031148 [Labeo rohita]
MGKTADLTVVQKTIIDTLHKEGKTQTFIAKDADCSQSAASKHVNRKLSGRKRYTTNRENHSLESKIDSRIWVNFTKEWTEAGVKASRATTHRRLKEFGYSCRIPLVKPLLNPRRCQRRLTSFQMRASFVFHLETKVLDSGERVEKLIAQVD